MTRFAQIDCVECPRWLYSKYSFTGILEGKLNFILGLFFNLSTYKERLRQCAQTKLPQRPSIAATQHSNRSSHTSIGSSLESPDSDKRYVTPPSSVQNSVQHNGGNDCANSSTRPFSDQVIMNKSTESQKSRLPVFGKKSGNKRQALLKWHNYQLYL